MAHIKRMKDKPRTRPWRAQVKRKGHPASVKMFVTKAQAERWAHEMEKSLLETGMPLTIKQLENRTLREIVTKYRDEITPTKGCRVSETAVLNAFLRHAICQKSLAYVKKKDAYAYIEERLRSTWRGKPITPRTVRRECNSLQHVFEVARERWGFENLVNPFRGIPIKGSSHRRTRRLHDGEHDKLDDAAKACRGLNCYYVPLAIALAVETGMRRQEVFNLAWQDIDFEKRTIHIRISKTGPRTIVLPFMADLLLKQLAYALANGEFADLVGPRPEKSERIFPMTKGAFSQSFAEVRRRAGSKDLTFHDLRREAGSRFDEAGLTTSEHDLMLGHASRDMASVYIASDLGRIRDKLDRHAFGGLTFDEMMEKAKLEGVPPAGIVAARAIAKSDERNEPSEKSNRRTKRALQS